MKIHLIVEGDSDTILFDKQRDWFFSLGLEIVIVPTYGKKNMTKTALKHYKIAMLNNADKIIFLPDQNGDECALVTRKSIGINSKEKAVTIVMKRKLEAWILADGKCIRDSINIDYCPSGQTDNIEYPKRKLKALMNRKLGYLPTEVEATTTIGPHFSIQRAASNSISAKRFLDVIHELS